MSVTPPAKLDTFSEKNQLTVLPLMALSELGCARIVTLRQRHSHGKARIRANIFIQQFMTKNYTLVYTVANLVLHRLHKCVREYMPSDYRWLTLYMILLGDIYS